MNNTRENTIREKSNESAEAQKTQVHNVIILDKSGSMTSIRQAAIDGFNETLSGIKRAQEKYADSQEHYITLLTFCDCEKRYVYDKVPVDRANKLTENDYIPCCCTPLYDAMGITLNAMRKHVADIEDVAVFVTIITDGQENSSREYSGAAIKALAQDLREEGWAFTYMGANQNAVEVARSLNIRNAVNFCADDEGVASCMKRDLDVRERTYAEMSCCCSMAPSERNYAGLFDSAFDESDDNPAPSSTIGEKLRRSFRFRFRRE